MGCVGDYGKGRRDVELYLLMSGGRMVLGGWGKELSYSR